MPIIQDIKVLATNPIEFLKAIQDVIIRGARYKENTFVNLTSMPLMAEFVVEIDEDKPETQWKDDGPIVRAIPLPVREFQYTKEQLEAMPIEEMRPIVGSRGVKGRTKDKMIKQYLAAVESGINAAASSEDEE